MSTVSTTPTKTYTLLASVPGAFIGKCSEILPNRLQCWKAADFAITITTPPAEGEAEPTVTTYQKCRAHAQIEKNADDAAAVVVTAEVAQTNADEAALATAQAAVAKDKAATTK